MKRLGVICFGTSGVAFRTVPSNGELLSFLIGTVLDVILVIMWQAISSLYKYTTQQKRG